jgi:hypothetical protein
LHHHFPYWTPGRDSDILTTPFGAAPPISMSDTPPPLPPDVSASPPIPRMSLAARLMNIFAVPGDVFEEVKTSPHRVGNWIVPAILGSIVGITALLIILSQPPIIQKIQEQQEQAIEKQMDKMVKSGQMTQQQADKQKEMMAKFTGPMFMKISGSIAAVILSTARIFFWAFALWLLTRWLLKADIPYLKTVEVVGLASMISILGTLVKLLLQVNFSNISSSPSLALVVRDFDPNNPLHLMLGALNLFDVWELIIMALGVARLAGIPLFRASFAVFGFWFFWSSLQILFASSMKHMFG